MRAINIRTAKVAEWGQEPAAGDEPARSGGVSDHFQFRRAIHRSEEAINVCHGDVFQLGFPALTALQDRQRPYDHDRRVADLEGKGLSSVLPSRRRRLGISFDGPPEACALVPLRGIREVHGHHRNIIGIEVRGHEGVKYELRNLAEQR